MGECATTEWGDADHRFTVRTARAEDAQGMLDLARNVFATSEHTLTTLAEFTMTLEEERAFIESCLNTDNSLFVVALKDEKIVGNLGLTGGKKFKERHMCVLGVGVHSEWRGRGVGTALMRAAIEWCRGHETLEMILLAVYESNTGAIELYRKLGFLRYGLLPGGCKHGDGTYHDQAAMLLWVKERG